MGAFAGIFLAYLLFEYYIPDNIRIYPTDNNPRTLYFDADLSPWWGRLVLQEVLQTFTFTLVYLVIKYDKSMRSVDRLVKAFCMQITYMVCISMTNGSGAALNPALAFG